MKYLFLCGQAFLSIFLFSVVNISHTTSVYAHEEDTAASSSAVVLPPNPDVTTLTTALEVLNDEPIKDVKKIEEVAEQRKDLLLDQVATSPATFLQQTTLTDENRTFPSSVQSDIEQAVKKQGKLLVVHMDGKEKSKTVYRLLSSTEKTSYELHFTQTPSKTLESGQAISVTAVQLDGHLVVAGGGGDGTTPDVTPTPAPTMPVIGEEKTLILLVNFVDDTSEPVTKSQVEQLVFSGSNSVNSYYKETSFNKTYITGNVYGWITISQPNKDCEVNFYNWSQEADIKAKQAGITLSNYHRVVYVFPHTENCFYGGLGSVGGSPSQSWILGYGDDKRIYEHEFGHNLGLLHANSIDCGNKAIDSYTKCYNMEYGDFYDIMGNFWWVDPASFQFNGPHKVGLGWIPQTNVKKVSTPGTYTFRVYNTESKGNNLQAITVFKSNTKEQYYVSYRKAVGLDSLLPSEVTRGASIHILNGQYGVESRLIDTTPETKTFTYADATLADGKSFTDPTSQITILQKSHTKDYTNIKVKIGKGYDDTDPTIAFTYPSGEYFVPKSKSITLKATATDDKGVVKVEFRRFDKLVCTDNKAPYTCLSYTDNVSGKQVVYQATVYDGVGNNTSTLIYATVQ